MNTEPSSRENADTLNFLLSADFDITYIDEDIWKVEKNQDYVAYIRIESGGYVIHLVDGDGEAFHALDKLETLAEVATELEALDFRKEAV